ncbi:MAG: Ada metal-binding domain-containing protein [Chthoniobacteraceae bacterium]
MNRFLLIFTACFCTFLPGWSAFGADVTLRDGTSLRGYKITAVEVNGLRISHADGAGLMDYDDLPGSLQKAYGWTDEKSKARRVARQEEAQRLRSLDNGQYRIERPPSPAKGAPVPAAAIEAIASLADPAKLATLGVRGANSRVQKITYWLFIVQQSGARPEQAIDEAFARFGWKGTPHGEETKATMIRNLARALYLGCCDAKGLEDMRRGQSPTIQRGSFVGDEMSVDHVLPRAEVPTLDNVLANLELMPMRMNSGKSAKLGEREKVMARRFVIAGVVKPELVAWAGPFDVRASPETVKSPPNTSSSTSTFVASKKSAVFHKAGCASSLAISKANLASYSSRDEAIQAGKRPCTTCKP